MFEGKALDEDLLYNYCFWLWEYQRRNKEYIYDCDHIELLEQLFSLDVDIVDDSKSDNKIVYDINGNRMNQYVECNVDFQLKYKRYYRNNKNGLSPIEIMENIIERNELGVIDNEDINAVFYRHEKLPALVEPEIFLPVDLHDQPLSINFDRETNVDLRLKGAELIMKEDSKNRIIADYFKGPKTKASFERLNVEIKQLNKEIQRSKIDFANKLKWRLKGRYIRNDYQRVIGLFMWDQMEKNSKIKKTNAMDELFKLSNKFIFIEKYNENTKLNEILKLTSKCIDEVEVYNMSS